MFFNFLFKSRFLFLNLGNFILSLFELLFVIEIKIFKVLEFLF